MAQLPFSDPTNVNGWELDESISDEFLGNTIDSAKWFVQGAGGKYQNGFKGRAPSFFVPENVSISDGMLFIVSKWEPDHDFPAEKNGGHEFGPVTSAAVISKQNFLYGYMETRCRAADGPISSSFWTTGKSGEMDVFEHYGNNPNNKDSATKYQSSFHDWRTPKRPTFGERIWTNEHQLPFRVADDFHVYGLEWNADYLNIFVDGVLIRCVTKQEIGDDWVADHAQKVRLDSETFPWEVKPADLKAADFPDGGRKFIVDYVRVWKRKPNGDDAVGCQPERNLLLNPGFENGFAQWSVTGNASLQNSNSHHGSKHVRVAMGGDGAVEQAVAVKPNTTYILSAWGKSLGTNNTTVFHDGWIGVKNYGGEFRTASLFKNKWHRRSLQFRTGATAKTATIFFTNQWSDEPVLIDSFELVEVAARPSE
jgi:hypothetical protein